MTQHEMKDALYSKNDAIDIAIKALEDLKAEQALRRVAEVQLEEQKHKVLFADAVSASDECILVRELAVMLKQSGLEIGERRLYDWLRGNGYVYRQPSGHNLPTQLSSNLGVLTLKKQAIVNAYGKVSITSTTKVTPKGQVYFFEKVMAQKELFNEIKAEKKGKK